MEVFHSEINHVKNKINVVPMDKNKQVALLKRSHQNQCLYHLLGEVRVWKVVIIINNKTFYSIIRLRISITYRYSNLIKYILLASLKEH